MFLLQKAKILDISPPVAKIFDIFTTRGEKKFSNSSLFCSFGAPSGGRGAPLHVDDRGPWAIWPKWPKVNPDLPAPSAGDYSVYVQM
jgi:hypothetical protein